MKRRPEAYSIIVVPRKSSEIRRFSISRRSIAAFASAVVVFFCAVAFIGGRMVAYRNAYRATEQLRHEASRFQLERHELVNRLVQLEAQHLRTSRYVAHLAAVGRERQPLVSGQGPVQQTAAPEVQEASFWRGDVVLGKQDIADQIDELLHKTTSLEERVHELFLQHPAQQLLWSSLPTIWPTDGRITSIFGDRRRWEGVGRWHEGIDIASSYGAPIIASADGAVTYVGYRGGYGKTIILDHGRGLTTLFGHCSEIYVREGMKVTRGMALGKVGNTGLSTGPHLHYEVRLDGIPLDPTKYVIEKT